MDQIKIDGLEDVRQVLVDTLSDMHQGGVSLREAGLVSSIIGKLLTSLRIEIAIHKLSGNKLGDPFKTKLLS